MTKKYVKTRFTENVSGTKGRLKRYNTRSFSRLMCSLTWLLKLLHSSEEVYSMYRSNMLKHVG